MVVTPKTVITLTADRNPHEKDVIARFNPRYPMSHIQNDTRPFVSGNAWQRGHAKDAIPHGDVTVA